MDWNESSPELSGRRMRISPRQAIHCFAVDGRLGPCRSLSQDCCVDRAPPALPTPTSVVPAWQEDSHCNFGLQRATDSQVSGRSRSSGSGAFAQGTTHVGELQSTPTHVMVRGSPPVAFNVKPLVSGTSAFHGPGWPASQISARSSSSTSTSTSGVLSYAGAEDLDVGAGPR